MLEDPKDQARSAQAATRMERVRRLPERDRLQQLVEAMEPGARLLGVRRLRGGITSRASAFRYAAAEGAAKDAVLRIATPGSHSAGPEHFKREMKTLSALAETEVPAPLPLLVDAAGEYFGMAAIVVSRLPGSGPGRPVRKHVFLRDLARALAGLHRLSLTGAMGHLPRKHQHEVRAELARPAPGDLADAPGGRELWSGLRQAVKAVTWCQPRLTHQDFWPGNTLWLRGRLTGIVDWTTAAVGDPRQDVAQCRADLAMMYGLDWARAFASEYEAASGIVLEGLAFWDLYVAKDAMVSLPFYLTGYHDLGLTDLTPTDLRDRLKAFSGEALAQLPP